jgi:hypothetical protein
VAGMIFHAKSQRLAAETARRPSGTIVCSTRLMDRSTASGGAAQPLAQHHLFDDVAEVSRTPNIRSAPRASPISNWCSRRARCTCCSPPSFSWSRPSAPPRALRSPGDHRPHVRGRGVHGAGADHTHPAGRERRGRQDRPIGGAAAGDPPRTRSILPNCRRFEKIEMRNVIFSYLDKSSETVFRSGRLTSPAIRRNRIHFGRQRIRQVDVPQGPSRAL